MRLRYTKEQNLVIYKKTFMCKDCKWVKDPGNIYVNHTTKCVYIAIPKCASTFIVHNIEDYERSEDGHIVERIVRQGYRRIDTSLYVDQCENRLDNYFTWTFIRNPISRFVSAWTEFTHHRQTTCHWEKCVKNVETFTVSKMLDYLETHPNFDPHVMTQTTLLDAARRLDFVGCLDTWKCDSIELHKHTGVTFDDTQPKRISDKSQKPVLSVEDLKRIQTIYKRDFELYAQHTHSRITKLYDEWNPTFQYHDLNCLLGEKAYQANDHFEVDNALLMNINPGDKFNGILAVADGKFARQSNYYLQRDHGSQYENMYHIYRYCGFAYYYMTRPECKTSYTVKEAALFAHAFSNANLGHDISCTMFFIHEYRQRKLTCPILLLGRCQLRPRIIEFLSLFLDPSLFVYLPDDQVWKVEKIHLFSSVKDEAFYNIYKFPDMIAHANTQACQRVSNDESFLKPNVFIAKTHEQKLVLAKWSVLTCPDLLEKLRELPDWIVVNPEDKDMTFVKLITLLQNAKKIVTSTGSICYAHEPFFQQTAKWYFLTGAQGPYPTYAHKYNVMNVPMVFDKHNTDHIFNEVTK